MVIVYRTFRRSRGFLKPGRCLAANFELVGRKWPGRWSNCKVGYQYYLANPDIKQNIKNAQITSEYEITVLMGIGRDNDNDEALFFWGIPEDPKTQQFVKYDPLKKKYVNSSILEGNIIEATWLQETFFKKKLQWRKK